MKTAEAKISPAISHQGGKREPFFGHQQEGAVRSIASETAPFFSKPVSVQAKLTVGQPNDKYEQEADAVADKVVQKLSEPETVQAKQISPSIPSIQAKCAECEKEDKLQKKEEEPGKDEHKENGVKSAAIPNPPDPPVDNKEKDKKGIHLKPIGATVSTVNAIQPKPIFESDAETPVQKKCDQCEKEENLQKKEGGDSDTASMPNIESRLDASKGSGTSLPDATRRSMESSIGTDFSNVKVHTDSGAVQMSKDLNALAFTHGSDIYFSSGKYDPSSKSGQHLLAHELTHTVQQGTASMGIQKQDAPAEHLTSLNEMLNRFDVPENQVIDLLRQLTVAEKATVNTDLTYKIRMAAAFNTGEMVQAVIILNPSLIQKLEWVEAAAGSAQSIDYPEISTLITSSLQPERDTLKTTHWRDFFIDVCDNSTIITAVTELHFDLKTQLEWIEEEADPSNISYSSIQSLITGATQPDRDALKTTHWREFFVGVCTNKTIITAVTDLHFDLKTQLEWIEEEADPSNIDYSEIQPLVKAATQPDRDVLKTTKWRDFFVGVCDNETMVDAVIDLNFDIKTKMEWMIEEGTHYSGFKKLLLVTSGPDKAIILADSPFLLILKDYFSTWDNFAKTVELLGRVIPNAPALMGDATVLATLTSAWTASSAALTCGGGATTAHEEGGWIYLNILTNTISTRRAAVGAQASIDLWDPTEIDDSVIVGTFHTHPNVGPCWGSPFASPADVRNANKRGLPNIVRGAFPAIANIIDVFGGPSQRLHLAGSKLFPGTSGGVEPQAPITKEYDFE